MAFIDLAIKDFNMGDYDLIETAFNGDVYAFFNYADKKGKFEEIVADDYSHNDYENDYIYPNFIVIVEIFHVVL